MSDREAEMSEMHNPTDNWKERLAAHAVPGGWVCVVDRSERVGEDIYRPVFVPAPPALVALEVFTLARDDNSTITAECYFNPVRVESLKPDVRGTSAYLTGGDSVVVSGTPRELAKRTAADSSTRGANG